MRKIHQINSVVFRLRSELATNAKYVHLMRAFGESNIILKTPLAHEMGIPREWRGNREPRGRAAELLAPVCLSERFSFTNYLEPGF